MKNKEITDVIASRLLPKDSRKTVANILAETDLNTIREQLDIFATHCYRFDPNHPRYDVDRVWYPKVAVA